MNGTWVATPQSSGPNGYSVEAIGGQPALVCHYQLFGADYRAAALQPGAVAYLDLQLACRTGSARLSSCAAGCASETLTLQRLTTPSGVPSCTP